MINDYACYCATLGDAKPQRLSGRKTVRNSLSLPTSGMARKIASAMVVLTLVLGLSSTVWYGMQINAALNAVGEFRTTHQNLSLRHTQLAARSREIRTPEQMNQAAGELGLYLPAKGQVRTP